MPTNVIVPGGNSEDFQQNSILPNNIFVDLDGNTLTFFNGVFVTSSTAGTATTGNTDTGTGIRGAASSSGRGGLFTSVSGEGSKSTSESNYGSYSMSDTNYGSVSESTDNSGAYVTTSSTNGSIYSLIVTGAAGSGGVNSTGHTRFTTIAAPPTNLSHKFQGNGTLSTDTLFQVTNGTGAIAYDVYGNKAARFYNTLQADSNINALNGTVRAGQYVQTNQINDKNDTVVLILWDGSFLTMSRNMKFPEQIRLGSALETFVQDDSDVAIMSWRKDTRLTTIHSILQMSALPTSNPGITKRVFMIDRGDGTSDLRIVN